jgi:hypothetical protein
LYAVLFIFVVRGTFADSLAFIEYPSNVQYNSTYIISWSTDDREKVWPTFMESENELTVGDAALDVSPNARLWTRLVDAGSDDW